MKVPFIGKTLRFVSRGNLVGRSCWVIRVEGDGEEWIVPYLAQVGRIRMGDVFEVVDGRYHNGYGVLELKKLDKDIIEHYIYIDGSAWRKINDYYAVARLKPSSPA